MLMETIDFSKHKRVRLMVMQGQARVSGDPRLELTTVLGSCIACCLFDSSNNVGGMNHFLLASPGNDSGLDEHYGVYLMEVLINEMLAYGADRRMLRAHLYGGANMSTGMSWIGTANAEFAHSFLKAEGIPLVSQSLGGSSARRVDFRPYQGMARCKIVDNAMAPKDLPTPKVREDHGDIELF
jgi:chemotaxis protein CheD